MGAAPEPTLLGLTELLLEKEPLPTEMPLLGWAGTEHAHWRELIDASATTNPRNWTLLAGTQLNREPGTD